MSAPPGYSIETAGVPDTDLEVGGLAVRESGSLLVCTRHGELWERDPDSGEWQLWSDALHQSLGLWLDQESEDLYCAEKTELVRLVDDTDTSRVDGYETITDEWGYSGNYHEFCFGPVQDSEGNFYLTINLSDGGDPVWGPMSHMAQYRGWAVKVTPNGEFEPFASGLRSPLGIGINSDDEVFYSDNQGDWVPTNHISHLQEGNFYGHPAALHDHPDYQDRDLADVPHEEFAHLRTPPVAWIPYSRAQSPGGVTFEKTGNFGPFEGQAFFGDQTRANLNRLSVEEVAGSYQGAVFPFADEFQCGIVREEFTADGQRLFVGQTDRGWGSHGSVPYGVQYVDYDGETVPFEMQSISIQPSGFRIEFTKPADTDAADDPSNYEVSHWTYDYHPEYGSGRVDETAVVTGDLQVVASQDGSQVGITLPSVGPATDGGPLTVHGRIYEIGLDGVTSADGDEMANPVGWYTVNDVP